MADFQVDVGTRARAHRSRYVSAGGLAIVLEVPEPPMGSGSGFVPPPVITFFRPGVGEVAFVYAGVDTAEDEDILDHVRRERVRAHAKHGDTSMESYPPDDLNRLAILMEEVGEVAKEFNEARHEGRPVDLTRLGKESVQTAAMAAAWADTCRGSDHD